MYEPLKESSIIESTFINLLWKSKIQNTDFKW